MPAGFRIKNVFLNDSSGTHVSMQGEKLLRKSSLLSNLKEKVARTKSLFSLSVIDDIYLKEFLVALIGDGPTFSQLRQPLYVVATDLISGKDVVFSRGELIDKALGYDFEGFDRTIDVHILNLRRKLKKADTSQSVRIETVYGAGYKLATGEK